MKSPRTISGLLMVCWNMSYHHLRRYTWCGRYGPYLELAWVSTEASTKSNLMKLAQSDNKKWCVVESPFAISPIKGILHKSEFQKARKIASWEDDMHCCAKQPALTVSLGSRRVTDVTGALSRLPGYITTSDPQDPQNPPGGFPKTWVRVGKFLPAPSFRGAN